MARPLPTREQAVKRFWSKVDRSGDCWTWQAATDRYGYGASCHNGRQMKAHRLAYLLFVGPLPAGPICHRCDNPPCVRPEHLFAGTPAINNRDRAAKGRSGDQSGERASRTKLCADDVRDIRRTYAKGRASQRELAARFGVSQTTIMLIVNRQRWQSIT